MIWHIEFIRPILQEESENLNMWEVPLPSGRAGLLITDASIGAFPRLEVGSRKLPHSLVAPQIACLDLDNTARGHFCSDGTKLGPACHQQKMENGKHIWCVGMGPEALCPTLEHLKVMKRDELLPSEVLLVENCRAQLTSMVFQTFSLGWLGLG